MSSMWDGMDLRSGGSFSNSDTDESDHDEGNYSEDTDDESRLAGVNECRQREICAAFAEVNANMRREAINDLNDEFTRANYLSEQRKMEFLKHNGRIFDRLNQAFEYMDANPKKWLTAFATDIPKKPREGLTKLPMAKTYLVGSPFTFFKAFYSMRNIVADEVICSSSGCPVPLYFDIEIKNQHVRNWKTRDDIDPYYFESVQNKIKLLFEGLGSHIEEDHIANLAFRYMLLSHGVWTEIECRNGLRVIAKSIERRLKAMLKQQIDAGDIDEEACGQMHVTSSCRKNKLSFHIVMDRIFCEHQSLSMPLVVHDIKGFFLEENVRWLAGNILSLESSMANFHVRALMINELMIDNEGSFDGKGGTPFDQAVYSPNHLLRCVMSSKFCSEGEPKLPMVPLCASTHSRIDARNVSSFGTTNVMTDDVRYSFDHFFGPDTISEWRKYTVTCRALVDQPQSIYVIARLKPNMWNYYPSKATWWKNHDKYHGDFDGISFACEGVETTVTELYGGKAELHYRERRNVVKSTGSAVPVASGDLSCNAGLSCNAHDEVRRESRTPCYLYQVGLGEMFFCGRGSANEQTPSAHLNHRSPDGGIIYTCFCQHCNGNTYRSVPKENVIDHVERRYPFSKEETIKSDSSKAKFRQHAKTTRSSPASQKTADNWWDDRVDELETNRVALFDQCKKELSEKYDWMEVLKPLLSKADGLGPQFYIIDAPCETGKTHEMKLLCEATQELAGRYMFVVHRRSLADLMHGLVDCLHYQHYSRKEFWDNAAENGQLKGHFVSCYNSLNRFGYKGKPDVVILDEVGALRRHIINKTTRSCLADAHSRFVRLIKEARLVVLLQHKVSLEDARFITSLADVDPQDRRRVVPLLVEKPTPMHPLRITSRHAVAIKKMIDKYVQSFNAVDDDSGTNGTDGREASSNNSSAFSSVTWSGESRRGKGSEHQMNPNGAWSEPMVESYRVCERPFVVFSTRKSSASYFAKLLKAKAVEIGADPNRIKLITASLKVVDEWNQSFFASPNERAVDCDVLIATSVIGSGISLDTHFGSFVAFLYCGVLTVDDDWQLIRRCRMAAVLRNAQVDRTSILYIEDGSGGGGFIDILSAVNEGVGLHEEIVSEIAKNSRSALVRARLEKVNRMKKEIYFPGLNQTYWTNIAERKKSQSKHGELWKELLEAELDPTTYESIDDTHQYCEVDLKAEDEAYNEWHKLQAGRICRKLGRGSEEHDLVPFEGSGDEDIETLLDQLREDDVLRLALSQQSVECSLSWNKAFPIHHGDKYYGVQYVAYLIQMKLLSSMQTPHDEKKLKVMRDTYAKHFSNPRWRNKYIRMAFYLCTWTAAFYNNSDCIDETFGKDILYTDTKIFEHIGGMAVANMMKTKICKALFPLLFTANPSELPYIKTPAESPYYVGLEVVRHPSLCAFFRWAFVLPETVGGEVECPIDLTMHQQHGIVLSEIDRDLLRRSTEHILTHCGHAGKKITILDLVSDVKEAHKFVQYLCRCIGLDLRTSGSLRNGADRVTVFRNGICSYDLALTLGTPKNIRRHFTNQLQLMGSGRNLPDEGRKLVEDALAYHEYVTRMLGIESVAGKQSLKGNFPFPTITLRAIEATKSDLAIAESNEMMGDEPVCEDLQAPDAMAIVESVKKVVDNRMEQYNKNIPPGLFHLISEDDVIDDTSMQSTNVSSSLPLNKFVYDEAVDDDDDDDDDVSMSESNSDLSIVWKRKRTGLLNGKSHIAYRDDDTVTTYPCSLSDSCSHSANEKKMRDTPSRRSNESNCKSPTESPVKKKPSLRKSPPRDLNESHCKSSAKKRQSSREQSLRESPHRISNETPCTSPAKKKLSLRESPRKQSLTTSPHSISNETPCTSPAKKKPYRRRNETPCTSTHHDSEESNTGQEDSYGADSALDAEMGNLDLDQLLKTTAQKRDYESDSPMEVYTRRPGAMDCRGCGGYPRKDRCDTCQRGIKSFFLKGAVPFASHKSIPNKCSSSGWEPALGDDEVDTIRNAIHGEGNKNDVLAEAIGEFRTQTSSVRRESFRRLGTDELGKGRWLNEEVINFFFCVYLARVDQRLCNENSNRKRCYMFSSYFMLHLLDASNDEHRLRGIYSYKSVQRWTRTVNIFDMRCLLFPVNRDNQHWMLACVFFESQEICYYDSMCKTSGDLNNWAKKRLYSIAQFIEDEYESKNGSDSSFDWSKWRIVHCETPQQDNSVDCGVFTCLYGYFIVNGWDFCFTGVDVTNFREWIALAILQTTGEHDANAAKLPMPKLQSTISGTNSAPTCTLLSNPYTTKVQSQKKTVVSNPYAKGSTTAVAPAKNRLQSSRPSTAKVEPEYSLQLQSTISGTNSAPTHKKVFNPYAKTLQSTTNPHQSLRLSGTEKNNISSASSATPSTVKVEPYLITGNDSVDNKKQQKRPKNQSTLPKNQSTLENSWSRSSSRKDDDEPNVLPGIRNCGNTCYLSASLQALYSIPQFLHRLYQSYEELYNLKKLPLTRALLEVAVTIGALKEVDAPLIPPDVARSTLSTSKAATPLALKKQMDFLTDKFAGCNQRDAHEFFGAFVDYLHEELVDSPSDENKGDDKSNKSEESNSEDAGEKPATVVATDLPTDEYFHLKVRVCLKCKSCGYSRSKEESYRHLSIDVREDDDGESWGAKRSLEHFFQEEDREVKCEKCADGTSATQTIQIISRPKAILLHFKRFTVTRSENGKMHLGKNTAKISLEESLSIDSFCSKEYKPNGIYRLCSAVLHEGSATDFGHYTAIGKRKLEEESVEEQWVFFNDENVKRRPLNDTNQSEYYMALFCLDNDISALELQLAAHSLNEKANRKIGDEFEDYYCQQVLRLSKTER